MRVAHFNTFTDGGSAVLMLRLHRALLEAGVESRVYYRTGHAAVPDSQRLEFARGFWARIRERVKLRLENLLLRGPGLFSTVRMPSRTALEGEHARADIFHLHWVSHWLDLPGFLASLPPGAPVVLTLHDLGMFTGGCHLYSGCHGFEDRCEMCPLLKAPFDRFLARRELRSKRRALGGRQVHVVGNSEWTTGLARRAAVFRGAASVRTIHPCIDPVEWARFDKAEAKAVLGIPAERFVAGFGCAELTDGNKNFGAFLELLRVLAAQIELEAVIFGNGLRLDSEPPVRIHHLGRLASSRLLSLAYSAMDVFVMTSRTETFGQVALEAQACGTPVCAFDVGGLREAVRHGETGLLSRYGDLGALAADVRRLAEDGAPRAALSQQAHARVRGRFTIEAVCRGYQTLYAEAVASPGKEEALCPSRS